jgi:hypothetical protein
LLQHRSIRCLLLRDTTVVSFSLFHMRLDFDYRYLANGVLGAILLLLAAQKEQLLPNYYYYYYYYSNTSWPDASLCSGHVLEVQESWTLLGLVLEDLLAIEPASKQQL